MMAGDRLACGKSRVPVHVLTSGAPAVHDHVFRLGAAAGGDTSHILGSFMKLRRSAGDLRACHDPRESQPAPIREGQQRGRMCAEGVSISLDDANSAWHCQTDRVRTGRRAGTCRERRRSRTCDYGPCWTRPQCPTRAWPAGSLTSQQSGESKTCGATTRRCVAGEQPRSPVPELAAIVLGDALGRKVSETELGMTPSDLPGDLGLQLPVGWTETIATSTALWRADVQRRRFLVNAVFTSAALPASALRWLTSPPAAAPSASGTRTVGHADIDAIRELTRSYREMDNRLGGGKLRSSVVSYLDDHVSRLLTTGSYQEETGRQLPAACGELSQLAGWVAYDSDEHGLAQRYLTQALAYSRHADDHALAAGILAAQAHQALYLARPDEAVDLARAAQAAAVRHGSATLLPACLVMEAQ